MCRTRLSQSRDPETRPQQPSFIGRMRETIHSAIKTRKKLRLQEQASQNEIKAGEQQDYAVVVRQGDKTHAWPVGVIGKFKRKRWFARV